MKTNFQMLKELEGKYHPKKRGFINAEESNLIKETLCLAEMDVLALRNLRDFTVAFFGNKQNDTVEDWDKMSAICTVIDSEIIRQGGEI
jgi:hypothetical protein